MSRKYIENPYTGYKILVGGPTFKKLVSEGKLTSAGKLPSKKVPPSKKAPSSKKKTLSSKKVPPSKKKIPCKKKCNSKQICNEETGRCVLKTGAVGKAILARKQTSPKKSSPKKKKTSRVKRISPIKTKTPTGTPTTSPRKKPLKRYRTIEYDGPVSRDLGIYDNIKDASNIGLQKSFPHYKWFIIDEYTGALLDGHGRVLDTEKWKELGKSTYYDRLFGGNTKIINVSYMLYKFGPEDVYGTMKERKRMNLEDFIEKYKKHNNM